jgi:hypothetical protein
MAPGGSTTPYTNGTTPSDEFEFPSKLEIYERLGSDETPSLPILRKRALKPLSRHSRGHSSNKSCALLASSFVGNLRAKGEKT